MHIISAFFLVLLGFAVVGSLEVRIRPRMERQEQQLEHLQSSLRQCEQKLDDLLQHFGDDPPSSPPKA